MTIENAPKFSFGNVQVNIFKIETRSVRKKNLTFSRPNSKNQKKKKKRENMRKHTCAPTRRQPQIYRACDSALIIPNDLRALPAARDICQ